MVSFTSGKIVLSAALASLMAMAVRAGEATWFTPSGAYVCGLPPVPTDLIVTLSPSEFADGANCWRLLNVRWQDKSVNVTVADLCSTCAVGEIDLSEEAFEQLANPDVISLTDVSYSYI